MKNLIGALLIVPSLVLGQLTNIKDQTGAQVGGIVEGVTVPNKSWFDTQVFNNIVNLSTAVLNRTYNVQDYATLAAALTDATTDSATLVVSNSQAITTNTTISGKTVLMVNRNGRFNISSGVTLTISVPVIAGPYRIFEGDGTVAFTQDAMQEIYYPQWWGAIVGDGNDDAGALNAAATSAQGATLYLPPGTYDTDTQWVLTLMDTSIQMIGYGAIIQPNGVNYGLSVRGTAAVSGGNNTVKLIEGVRVDATGNFTALGGFEVEQGWNVRFVNTQVTHDSSAAGTEFSGWRAANRDSSDNDTGSFWTLFQGGHLRRTGARADSFDIGILLEGTPNATRIVGNNLNNFLKGVVIRNHAPATSIPNSIYIENNYFESGSKAINIESSVTAASVGMPTCIGNRFEKVDTVYVMDNDITGTGNGLKMFGNFYVNPIDQLMLNPQNLPYVNMEFNSTPSFVGVDSISFLKMRGNLTLEAEGSANHPLYIVPGGGSRGIAIRNSADDDLALNMIWSGTGDGAVIEGGNTNGLRVSQVRGISQTSTEAENLRGTVTFASAATATVTFGTAEPDATYFINLGQGANETFWWSGKGTGGFTINSSNASSTAVVDWHITR